MERCSGGIKDPNYPNEFREIPCPDEALWINNETGNKFCEAHRRVILNLSTLGHKGFTPISIGDSTGS